MGGKAVSSLSGASQPVHHPFLDSIDRRKAQSCHSQAVPEPECGGQSQEGRPQRGHPHTTYHIQSPVTLDGRPSVLVGELASNTVTLGVRTPCTGSWMRPSQRPRTPAGPSCGGVPRTLLVRNTSSKLTIAKQRRLAGRNLVSWMDYLGM